MPDILAFRNAYLAIARRNAAAIKAADQRRQEALAIDAYLESLQQATQRQAETAE